MIAQSSVEYSAGFSVIENIFDTLMQTDSISHNSVECFERKGNAMLCSASRKAGDNEGKK